MKTSLLLAINVALIFAANAPAQEMPGGLWEIKTKMDMPGLPAEMAAKMGAHAMTHCVKPGERKWNEQRNPNDREKQCEQTELKAPVAKPHRMQVGLGEAVAQQALLKLSDSCWATTLRV